MSLDTLLQAEKYILSQGSTYELLRRNPDVVLDEHIFHAGCIYTDHDAAVLERVFRSYIDTAIMSNFSITVGAATWRANKERIRASAFPNCAVNEDNVQFLKDIRDSYGQTGKSILVEGEVGPRGDAYKPQEALDTDAARSFHSYQVEALASSGVDYLQASTLPALSEAIGIALVMAETGVPYFISFVVDRSGRLLDGTMISEAVTRIDDAVGDNTTRYSINCVHPEIALQALDKNPEVEGRIISFYGNTSDLSPAELDGSEELQTQDPDRFALANKKLIEAHYIPIIGACCGSSPDHIKEIANMLDDSRKEANDV